jgi:hypothetical protein
MVDDRAMRFRGQVAPPPRPRPLPVLPPAAQRPQPRPQPTTPSFPRSAVAAERGYGGPSTPAAPVRRSGTTIFGQPVDYNRNANIGNAIMGTALGALDVPVQAIGGMHRDVISGGQTGGRSAGSRAVGDYGNLVKDLWSGIGSGGQTEPFLPREFEAAGEAAVDRFGLEGGAASAAMGGATALDLLTGLGAGGLGSAIRSGAPSVSLAAARARPAFQSPDVRQAALMRAIMLDPDTSIRSVRSMDSAEDIIGGSGRFLSSRQTGTSPASRGDIGNYNPIREIAENATWGPGVDNVQYGYVASPVLRNQPRPFQIGSSGRKALEEFLETANALDDYTPGLNYGQGKSTVLNPVQYQLNPEALNRAQYFPTDSLSSQWQAGLKDVPERVTQSFDEFINSNQGIPNFYLEAQIPNLTIDDVSKINAMTGTQTMLASDLSVKADAQSRMAAINKLLEQGGREIPVGAITEWNSSFMPSGVGRSNAYRMPPTPRENFSSYLRQLRRDFNEKVVKPPVVPRRSYELDEL